VVPVAKATRPLLPLRILFESEFIVLLLARLQIELAPVQGADDAAAVAAALDGRGDEVGPDVAEVVVPKLEYAQLGIRQDGRPNQFGVLVAQVPLGEIYLAG